MTRDSRKNFTTQDSSLLSIQGLGGSKSPIRQKFWLGLAVGGEGGGQKNEKYDTIGKFLSRKAGGVRGVFTSTPTGAELAGDNGLGEGKISRKNRKF